MEYMREGRLIQNACSRGGSRGRANYTVYSILKKVDSTYSRGGSREGGTRQTDSSAAQQGGLSLVRVGSSELQPIVWVDSQSRAYCISHAYLYLYQRHTGP